jgi:hypothetical protein
VLNIPVRYSGTRYSNYPVKGFLQKYTGVIPKGPPQLKEAAILKMKLSPNWYYKFGSPFNDSKLRGDANLGSTALSRIQYDPLFNTVGIRFRNGGKTYLSPCTYPKFLQFSTSRSLGRYWNQHFRI